MTAKTEKGNKKNNNLIYSTIEFGEYPHINKIFKQPIEWSIIDVKRDKLLIISKYCIDCQQYDKDFVDTCWKECELRYWLNKQFYNNAFNKNEKSKICLTDVSPDINPDFNTNQGYYTKDYIFCLSILEYYYYFKENCGYTYSTCYSANNGTWRDTDSKIYFGCSNWWLRSLGGYSKRAAFVGAFGNINTYGLHVDCRGIGIRPTMWIDQSQLNKI